MGVRLRGVRRRSLPALEQPGHFFNLVGVEVVVGEAAGSLRRRLPSSRQTASTPVKQILATDVTQEVQHGRLVSGRLGSASGTGIPVGREIAGGCE